MMHTFDKLVYNKAMRKFDGQSRRRLVAAQTLGVWNEERQLHFFRKAMGAAPIAVPGIQGLSMRLGPARPSEEYSRRKTLN